MEGNEKERTLYTGRTQVGLKLESRQAVIARYSISRSILVEKKKTRSPSSCASHAGLERMLIKSLFPAQMPRAVSHRVGEALMEG